MKSRRKEPTVIIGFRIPKEKLEGAERARRLAKKRSIADLARAAFWDYIDEQLKKA